MKNKKNKSVGAATKEILEKPQHEYQVQEIIDEYANKYVKELETAVQENCKRFESPFYVVVLHKKEPWALNVLRNWFIGRQTCPSIQTMWNSYKNFMHTIYEVDGDKGDIRLVRSLPSPDEAKVIVKNFHLYDSDLVRWCHQGLQQISES